MFKVSDRIILLISAGILAFVLIKDNVLLLLIPFLSVLSLSSINYIFNNFKPVKFLCLAGYLVPCFFFIEFIIFMPVLFYDFNIKNKYSAFCLISVIPFFLNFNADIFAAFILLAIIAFFLNFQTLEILLNKKKYFSLKETSAERESKQKKAVEELKDSHYYKINMIKAEERNAIAAEIHDNVGHLLSSSILLTGALISTSKESATKESLVILKNSLQEAMTNIRKSVHNIHQDIYNLENEVLKLTENFTFCAIELIYHINSVIEPEKCKHIVSIIKECLTNVIKHSNASKVVVSLKEHPAIYQLIVHDNGTAVNFNGKNLGLKSIEERVQKIEGILNISSNEGFKVFISFKKERQ